VVIWYFFSSETQEAARQVEVKMAFGIVPVLLVGSGLTRNKAEKGILVFVAANFLSAVFLLLHALLRYWQNSDTEVFFYSKFSTFHHVTYFSMYLVFSIGWLLMKGIEEYYKFPKIFIIPILIFSISIFLASSKIMVITYTLASFFTAIYIARRKKILMPSLSLILIAILLPVILYFVSDNFRLRVNYGFSELTTTSENRNPERIGSTGLRMVVWSEVLPIIRKNPVWGIGPGNVQNELQKIYKAQRMEAAEKRKLNLHNEYLQQLAGNGIPGLMLFLLIVLLPYFLSAKPMKFASLIFSFTLIMASVSESIFERQAGTLFAGLIGVLLILSYGRISKPSDS
jgi:O-antigen ligase